MMPTADIKEDLLHYVWRTQHFDHRQLTTASGQPLEIHQYGRLNQDAGPDFLEAKVKIGNTLWAGQVEMHVRASDWRRHQHAGDPQYDNVILHVVYHYDEDVLDPSGHPLPVLDLNTRIDPYVLEHYHHLQRAQHWVPCQPFLRDIEESTVRLWLDSVIAQRLTLKSKDIQALVDHYNGDWEAVTYHALLRTMGLKVNVDAMDALAYQLPRQILYKNADQIHHLEALLFGQAGLLQALANEDDYTRQLSATYRFLQQKYNLQPISADRWRYSRMRPVNFPTIRLAQLATILHQQQAIFQYIREHNSEQIVDLLSVRASSYWDQHYRLGRASDTTAPKNLGRSTIDNILINGLAPVLYAYGMAIDDYASRERAIELLYDLKAENNKVIRRWRKAGFSPDHAAHSQALLHLKKHYCDAKKCLSCGIGHQVVKQG